MSCLAFIIIGFFCLNGKVVQQVFLSCLSLKEYIINAPRTSIVSANKEGIVSLLGTSHTVPFLPLLKDDLSGYLSIQLLGLSVGTMILPPSPSFFQRRKNALLEQDKDLKKQYDDNTPSSTSPSSRVKSFDLSAPRQTGKIATELCAYGILWWAFLGFLWLIGLEGKWGPEGGISRRMVRLLISSPTLSLINGGFLRLTYHTYFGLQHSTPLFCSHIF